MKYMNKWYIACLAMVLCCLVSACSDDEDVAPAEVSFTAPGDFDMASLDSCESIVNTFELTSNCAWNLCSDRMWVKLSLHADGEFYNDIQGAEGTHKVYIKVTNEARSFDDAKANVTLMAGNVSKSVVTIERKGKGNEFALLSKNGTVLEKIEIGSNASIWVAPDANFDCSIIAYPDWLVEPEVVDGGFKLAVISSLELYPYKKEGTVIFGNADESVTYEVPVVYAWEPTYIMIESDHTPWDWNVTLDGKTFLQEVLSASGEYVETIVENAFEYNVTCLNYDYKLIPAQVYEGKLVPMDVARSWIRTSRNDSDPSKVTVSVTSLSSDSRSGCLFAVPAGYYNNFMDSLLASSNATDFIDSNLSYVMLELQQRELENRDGFVITAEDGTLIDEVSIEDEYYEYLCSEFGTTDITSCYLVPGNTYIIEPKLNKDDWGGNLNIQYLDGVQENPELMDWGINKQPKPDSDGLYKVKIKVPKKFNKEVLMRLYTPDGVNIKALLIRPVTQ